MSQRSVLVLVAILANLQMPGLGPAVAADAPSVDMAAVADAGQKMAQKLRISAASWVASSEFDGRIVVDVSVVSAPGRLRADFTFSRDGKRFKVFELIVRDGYWYVTDRLGSRRYRPYEAPVDTPLVYLALARSMPRFVMPAAPLSNATLESVHDGVADYRQPIPPATAKVLQGTVDKLEALPRQTGHALTPELQKTMASLKDLLAHGTPNRVDLATGMLTEYGAFKLRTHITDFHLSAQPDEQAFAIDAHKWADNADDPTTGNLDNLIMIGNQPGMQPGQKDYELDARLLDITTGRFRRIPYPGGLSTAGCFLRDRRAVVVCGLNDDGAVRPYRIDLKTRACTPIGGPLFDGGITFGMALSPDGKTILTAHLDASSASMLDSQLCLIDVASGKAKTLGKPLDTAYLGWAADAQHIILLHREAKDMNSRAITSVATMDMSGNVTVLCLGNAPVVLADGQTIMFQDNETQLWHTCDLQGQNIKLLADGLKGYGFPAPGPNGKQMLMMHYTPGSLPEPVLLQIGESEGRAVPHGDGLWAMPVWR